MRICRSDTVDTSTPSPAANVAPAITAQSAQSFEEQTDYNVAVTATDSDGSIASYEWTQLSGSTLTLTNTDAATLTFQHQILLLPVVGSYSDGNG